MFGPPTTARSRPPRRRSSRYITGLALLAASLTLVGCSAMATTDRGGNHGGDGAGDRGGSRGSDAAVAGSQHAGAQPVSEALVTWPEHTCTAEESASGSGGANYRSRLIDEVGPSLPFALLMPVDEAITAAVYPSFGAPRSGGRQHEGVDIMAPRGTPIRPAAPGFVTRLSTTDLGGISVTLVGDGGVRYFYTHLDSIAAGLEVGQYVEVTDVIGYVGNTGNAAATAPHLHFGVYLGGLGEWCGWRPIDPLPLLVDRSEV